jgi:hypothetical protein
MLIAADRKALYAVAFAVIAVAALLGGGYFLASPPSFVKCQAEETANQSGAGGHKQFSGSAVSELQSNRAGHEAASPSQGEQDCSEDPALAKFTWQLARYTAGLFGATVALVLLGAAQLLYLGKSDRTARLGLKIAARQAAINRRQMLISGQQTDILEKQKEMQRQEFLITHRPRIRFRTVSFLPNEDESLFRAQYVNIGPTEARILHTHLRACVQMDTGNIVDIVDADFDVKFSLGLGNTKWIEATVKEPGTPLERASRKITVIASVVYADGRDRILASSVARGNGPPSIRLNVTEGLEDMNWED